MFEIPSARSIDSVGAISRSPVRPRGAARATVRWGARGGPGAGGPPGRRSRVAGWGGSGASGVGVVSPARTRSLESIVNALCERN